MNTIGMAPYKGRKVSKWGFPCKGNSSNPSPDPSYSDSQYEWMKENKPLYYTGSIFLDIHHLPLALRFD